MDLKFDYVTLAILLYRARREIALDKALYKCRSSRYINMSYEEWKKKHIKKESEENGQNTTDTDML